MTIDANQSQLSFEERGLKYVVFFWLGFIIYSVAFVLFITEAVNSKICNLFQTFGLLMLLPSAILLIRFRFDNEYLKSVFIIYCFWTLGVILRGIQLNFGYFQQIVFNAYQGLFLYLAPLIILFPRNVRFIKVTIRAILLSGLLYVILDLIFIKNLLVSYDLRNSQNMVEYFSKSLAITCGFVLITYIYHSRKVNLFALGVILLVLVFAVFRARRALIFLAISPLIVTYIVYVYYSRNFIFKVLLFIFIASVFAVSIAFWQSIIDYLGNSSASGWLIDRISHDTRSGVEEHFYRDMTTTDWIIGKGMDGKYYCPGIREGAGRVSIYRNGVETDYLTIILKGGLISLGLMLLITIPAIVKGLFQSKNLLSKAASVWILFYLIDLYPTPVTTFTLNYLLVWISIGICYSKEIRQMSDESIKEILSVTKSSKPGQLPADDNNI